MEKFEGEISVQYTEPIQNEMELIDRKEHELILRKCRLSTQRLIKEYQTKIQQQNRQIELLMKEVKRQKAVIDTLTKVNNGTVTTTIRSDKSNEVEKIETDLELDAIFYSNNKIKPSSHKTAKEKHVNSFSSLSHRPRIHTKTIECRIERSDVQRKKTSLVSIEIQPNIQAKIQNSTNVYTCDECNKQMSSRRVLAVCILEMMLVTFQNEPSSKNHFFLYRNTSVWFTVYKRNSFVIIVRRRSVCVMD